MTRRGFFGIISGVLAAFGVKPKRKIRLTTVGVGPSVRYEAYGLMGGSQRVSYPKAGGPPKYGKSEFFWTDRAGRFHRVERG